MTLHGENAEIVARLDEPRYNGPEAAQKAGVSTQHKYGSSVEWLGCSAMMTLPNAVQSCWQLRQIGLFGLA